MSVTGWPYAPGRTVVGGDAAAGRAPAASAPKAKRRRALRWVATALLLVAGLAAADFLSFAHRVATAAPPTDARADGMVVLTGGADRIPSGLGLLAEGRAQRMLISGVNPKIADASIARDSSTFAAFKDCCIDLGREAADTIGNAAEARKWVETHGYSSLMVVTSAYHMPRSIAEISAALPSVEIVPYPVVRAELSLDSWYEKPETARLLGAEYLKYLLVRVRLVLEHAGLADAVEPRRAD